MTHQNIDLPPGTTCILWSSLCSHLFLYLEKLEWIKHSLCDSTPVYKTKRTWLHILSHLLCFLSYSWNVYSWSIHNKWPSSSPILCNWCAVSVDPQTRRSHWVNHVLFIYLDNHERTTCIWECVIHSSSIYCNFISLLDQRIVYLWWYSSTLSSPDTVWVSQSEFFIPVKQLLLSWIGNG
jgi:hypothetical protein